MKALFLFLFCIVFALASPAWGKEDPLGDPIRSFSQVFAPFLGAFEKASVETTLRGFIARGDSFPSYEKSNMDPSEYGIYLNVAVKDDSQSYKSSKIEDESKQMDGFIRRGIAMPPKCKGAMGLQIEFSYGSEVPKDLLKKSTHALRP